MKTTITILFLLIAGSAIASPEMEENYETRKQCMQRNRENNQKLEQAGYYVSPETKERQQELCDEKE